MTDTPSLYPGKVAIRRAMEAAKAGGLDVTGLEITPNGTIRIFNVRSAVSHPDDLVEELRRRGEL